MLNNELIGIINDSTSYCSRVISVYKKYQIQLRFDKYQIYDMKLVISMFGRWYKWVVLRYINIESTYKSEPNYKLDSIEFGGYPRDDLVEIQYILNGPIVSGTFQSATSDIYRVYSYNENINLVDSEYRTNDYRIYLRYRKNKIYKISIFNVKEDYCNDYISNK